MPMTHGTCQICARRIGTKTGRIAHHGYRRPHEGHQTTSCYGARALPYEVDCALLRRHVDDLARFHAQMGATLEYTSWGAIPVVERSARRDSFSGKWLPAVMIGPLDRRFKWVLDQVIRRDFHLYWGLGKELEWQRERLAAWKAPG